MKWRLIEFLSYLGIGQAKFETNVNLSRGFVNNVGDSIRETSLAKIAAVYPELNINWLKTGEGEMLRPGVSAVRIGNVGRMSGGAIVAGNHNSSIGNGGAVYRGSVPVVPGGKALTPDGERYTLVPVYNLDAVGGMDRGNDVTDAPAYIERHVPFIGAREGDLCVHVTGNSMAPTHYPGSLLLIRRVEGWTEYFGYGHCFVLFLNDGRRILKEVQRFSENAKEYILCVSHNREYPPEELPKSMIAAVYKVIMTLTNEGF